MKLFKARTIRPLLLHYFITNRCNAQCQFCGIWKEQPKRDAETDYVISNLYHAREAGCKFVDFTGGEPLLHPELPLFLRKAREFGFITSVTTNALLFPVKASELAGLVDLLHFSIDADNRQLNDRIHGTETYEAVMASIPIALSRKLVPDLLFTYSDLNIHSFMGIYRIARENRIIVILDPQFNLAGRDTVSEKTHHLARRYSRLPGVYLNKAHLLLRKQGGNNRKKPLCKAVSSTLVILPDNSLALPCYHHRTDSIKITHSLDYIINTPKRFGAIHYQGTYPFCEGCHINCYFDPSFTVLFNNYFLLSILAKISYGIQKYLFYRRPLIWPHQRKKQ